MLMVEVVFELGDGVVWMIVMDGMDGLKWGMVVENIDVFISVLVGDDIFGWVFNVLGEFVDNGLEFGLDVQWMLIYCDVLKYEDLSNMMEVLEMGIKVIDFFVLYVCGGKIGFFGGVGVGKIVLIQELIYNIV